jgi:hypothetical protein
MSSWASRLVDASALEGGARRSPAAPGGKGLAPWQMAKLEAWLFDGKAKGKGKGKVSRPAVKGNGKRAGTPSHQHALEASAVRTPCNRCGLSNHHRQECHHALKACNQCGRTGHLAAMCKQGAQSAPERIQAGAAKGGGKGRGKYATDGAEVWICPTCTHPSRNMALEKCPRRGCAGIRLSEATPHAAAEPDKAPMELDHEDTAAPGEDACEDVPPKGPAMTNRRRAELMELVAQAKKYGLCTQDLEKQIVDTEPKESQEWQLTKATRATVQKHVKCMKNISLLETTIAKMIEDESKSKTSLQALLDKETETYMAKMANIRSQQKLIIEKNEREIKEKQEELETEKRRRDETLAKMKASGLQMDGTEAPQEAQTSATGTGQPCFSGTPPRPLPTQPTITMPELNNEAQAAGFCLQMSTETRQCLWQHLAHVAAKEKEREEKEACETEAAVNEALTRQAAADQEAEAQKKADLGRKKSEEEKKEREKQGNDEASAEKKAKTKGN